MTRKEIRENIELRLDEDNVFRSDTEINDAIQEAQKVLTVLTLCFNRFSNISVKSGQSIYSVPYDFFLPLRVSIADDYPNAGANSKRLFPTTIQLISKENKAWFDSSNTPTHYFMLCGLGETGSCPEGKVGRARLWLYPRPNADKILRLDYVYFPQELQDDEEPDLPEAYHRLLEDYGVYFCLLKERDRVIFQKALALWDDFIQKTMELRNLMIEQYEGVDFEFRPWDWIRERREVAAEV